MPKFDIGFGEGFLFRKREKMTLQIFFTSRIKEAVKYHIPAFSDFIQSMANRIGFGSVRYDPPSSDQQYMHLIQKEFRAYKRTGNCEHLYNIANYCYLETVAPGNKKFHFKADVKSIRRNTNEN